MKAEQLPRGMNMCMILENGFLGIFLISKMLLSELG